MVLWPPNDSGHHLAAWRWPPDQHHGLLLPLWSNTFFFFFLKRTPQATLFSNVTPTKNQFSIFTIFKTPFQNPKHFSKLYKTGPTLCVYGFWVLLCNLCIFISTLSFHDKNVYLQSSIHRTCWTLKIFQKFWI